MMIRALCRIAANQLHENPGLGLCLVLHELLTKLFLRDADKPQHQASERSTISRTSGDSGSVA
jgi:hypothetical protein